MQQIHGEHAVQCSVQPWREGGFIAESKALVLSSLVSL